MTPSCPTKTLRHSHSLTVSAVAGVTPQGVWPLVQGILAVLVIVQPITAQAQTGRLNDTGQTSCYNAANSAVACDAATAGNTGTHPHQDGRYGRDAARVVGGLPVKTGGGVAGFDFSCVLWNGTVINGANCTVGLVANTTGAASGTPATDWACTRDNTTGVVWSLQTQGPLTWNAATGVGYADAGHNTPSRCGYSSAWRVPTRRELLSIVHHGLATAPRIDTTYFPSTQNNWHWTADTFTPSATFAWIVHFNSGDTSANSKAVNHFVRLVRSAQ